MAPRRRLLELIDDATEEILLRIPPEEPAHLVRTSLVCKLWRRRLLDPAFLRRCREFHRPPPMLGFLKNPRRTARTVDHVHAPRFVPTTSATPVPKPAFDFSVWRALSCYHGRVVVDEGYIGVELAVWDPVTGHRQKLPRPRIPIGFNNAAAVLCAVGSCNHLDCHGGPCQARMGILEFDLDKNCLSMMDTLDMYPCRSNLYMWSRKLDTEGSARWVQRRIINFEKLLPINNPRIRPNASMIGFAEVLGVIFMGTDVGVFVMDLIRW
ncbi:hypothetical protein GQ55_8G123100 [Panicum hallii var. hallii]|uniref:F-box domain-containing protein n=1 Tax=Panicum hallii var. hallii TaxID=1504633 RepID=A0A2T7CMU6_9POAL|nr:hypothetical protein GQ55_8G123100 [Panicum hallii var. hallii]